MKHVEGIVIDRDGKPLNAPIENPQSFHGFKMKPLGSSSLIGFIVMAPIMLLGLALMSVLLIVGMLFGKGVVVKRFNLRR